MKVIIVAYYEFIRNIKDLKWAAFIIILPLVMTLLLGTAVGKAFSSDIAKSIDVGFINKDTGSVGNSINKFLYNKDVSTKINVITYSEKLKAQEALDNNKIDALIYIPEAMSLGLEKGDKEYIQVSGSKNVEFIESLISNFTAIYNAESTVLKISGSNIEVESNSNIKRIFYSDNQTIPTATDYYAVLTMLQMLVIGAILGVFISSKQEGTDLHIRIYSLPVSKGTIIGGKIIGSTGYLTLAAIINVVGTKFLYHANWSGNPFITIGTLLIFSSIVIGIGVAIGLYVKSLTTSLLLVMLLMIFFGTLSGSVSPTNTVDSIAKFIPNYHSKILLFGNIYGYSKSIMLQSALWLLGIAAIVYSVILLGIRRRNYDNI